MKISFQDLKDALEGLPFGLYDVQPSSRLVEDYQLEEEDVEMILTQVADFLQVEFPDDDAFYRFAGHLPVVELLDSIGEWSEIY